MLNFPLGNLIVGVCYEALQQHADVEILGSGCSVVELKNIFFSVEKCFSETWESFSQCSKFLQKIL